MSRDIAPVGSSEVVKPTYASLDSPGPGASRTVEDVEAIWLGRLAVGDERVDGVVRVGFQPLADRPGVEDDLPLLRLVRPVAAAENLEAPAILRVLRVGALHCQVRPAGWLRCVTGGTVGIECVDRRVRSRRRGRAAAGFVVIAKQRHDSTGCNDDECDRSSDKQPTVSLPVRRLTAQRADEAFDVIVPTVLAKYDGLALRELTEFGRNLIDGRHGRAATSTGTTSFSSAKAMASS
jgi:hypothetical protein